MHGSRLHKLIHLFLPLTSIDVDDSNLICAAVVPDLTITQTRVLLLRATMYY